MKVLVIDNGFNTELARRLGESGLFDDVAYFSPWQADFVATRERAVGTGFVEFERVYDVSEKTLSKFDAFVFPDLYWATLAGWLQDTWKVPVWSAFDLEELELNRVKLLKTMEQLGMKTPLYRVRKGISNALAMSRDGDYIKVTGYARGDMETSKHEEDYPTWPHVLRKRLGPLAEEIPIVISRPIEDDHEVGWDTILLGGEIVWPFMLGYEDKDNGYLSTVIAKFPGPLADDSMRLLKHFANTPYTQFMSTEFRGNILIDLTTRAPSPPSDVHLGFWTNFCEAVHSWFANGERPTAWKPAARYAAEVIIKNTTQGDYVWMDVPKELRKYVGVRHAFVYNGKMWAAPPRDDVMEEVGAIWSPGRTPEAAIDEIKHIAAEIKKSDCLKIDTDVFTSLLEKAEKGEKEGIPF